MYVVCGCNATDDDASDLSPHHKDSSSIHTSEDVSCTRQRTRQRQRNQVTKKRRRILQTIDSSAEDDLDISNNNKLSLPSCSRLDHSVSPRTDQIRSSPCSTSHRDEAHSSEFTGSGRTGLIGSGPANLLKTSVPYMQSVVKPADCAGSGHTGLIGSRQPDSLSRSVLLIQSKSALPTEVTETSGDFNSVKSVHHNRSSNTAKISNLAASDVATFSLAFDDFLDSEEEDDIDDEVTEYTRLKAPNGGISATEKPVSNSRDVVSSRQVAETCTPVCATMSGRPGSIGSGQHSSERGSKTTMSVTSRTLPQIDRTTRSGHCPLTRSQRPSSVTGSGRCELSGSTLPQLNCTVGSGQCEVIGSQRPSSVTSSAQLKAERLREERIRLSRLKKEEFQRKFATTLPHKQPQMSSSAVDNSSANDLLAQTSSSSVDTAQAKDMDDHQQTKLRVLVDSRELSSAQVSY